MNGKALKIAGALIAWTAAGALAESRTWVGPAGGNWFTASHWSPEGTPAESDTLMVNSGSPQSGGLVTTDNGGVIAIQGASASAQLTSLRCGYAGWGRLHVLNGAQLAGTGSTIGEEVGSLGEVVVGGPNASWTQSGAVTVGYSGSGDVAIENGSSASFGSAVLGWQANSNGYVEVSLASLTVNGDFTSGGYGRGDMLVRNGAQVDTGSRAHLAEKLGSIGTVTVEDANSTWVSGNELFVGSKGTGTLTIRDSGRVDSGTHTSSTAGIGAYAGSNGTVSISGGGSWYVTGLLYVGGVTSAGGTGQLSVASGGRLETDRPVTIWGGGTVSFTGGTIQCHSIDHTHGGTFTFSGGVLHVGAFSGNLVNSGGTVAPGTSAGTTTVSGDASFGAASTLDIELGGTAPGTQHDQLQVGGTASLGGTLAVSLINSFVPSPGEHFVVLTYGSRLGQFDAITGWGGGGGLAYPAIYGANALTLHCTYYGDASLDGCVDGGDYSLWADNYALGVPGKTWVQGDFSGDGIVDGADYTFWADNYEAGCGGSPIPEPAALALLAVGSLAALRRRRNS